MGLGQRHEAPQQASIIMSTTGIAQVINSIVCHLSVLSIFSNACKVTGNSYNFTRVQQHVDFTVAILILMLTKQVFDYLCSVDFRRVVPRSIIVSKSTFQASLVTNIKVISQGD